MLISRELDVTVTNRIVGVRSVLDGFRWRMENERNIDKLMDLVEPCADLLLAVVDDVTRGDGFGEDLASYTTAEFLKKAADDSMTPGKLSSLFTGKPKTWMQNLVVDCKLLDALFEMTLAPYNRYVRVDDEGNLLQKEKEHAIRHARSDPWRFKHPIDKVDHRAQLMEGAKGLQKLAFVALQRIFDSNERVQNYFGRRKARVVEIKESARKSSVELADASFGHDPAALELLIKSTKGGDDNTEGDDNEEDESFTALDEVGMPTEKWVPWLEMTAKQAESGLGSSVTLSKLVDNNETLMREAVTPDLLK